MKNIDTRFVMGFLCCITAILSISFSRPTDVYIQPLGNVKAKHIDVVKNAIKSVYGYQCVVLPAANHNKKLYTSSKTRYDANKILKHYASSNRIIIITEKDIAHYKSSLYPEWGIFGLGSFTNKNCVVSTYRLGSANVIGDRLVKVTIHEIGHTLGLNHCTKSKNCVMQSAKGSIKTLEKESFDLCKECKMKIKLI